MTRRLFKDLSPMTQRVVVLVGAIQVALNIAAQVDITRRPASQVRGPKAGWRLASLINFFGPVAYFRWGRVSTPRQPE